MGVKAQKYVFIFLLSKSGGATVSSDTLGALAHRLHALPCGLGIQLGGADCSILSSSVLYQTQHTG